MGKRKVVLFVVEGITDQQSMALLLEKVINTAQVRFHIVGTDITSDYGTNPQNAKKRIGHEVKCFMKRYWLEKTDILEVVHLIDTDGCYLTEDYIDDGEQGILTYTEDRIIADPSKKILARNEKKSQIVNILSSMTKVVSSIPYRVFYFSCNREHVFHNIVQAMDSEKNRLADEFVDSYVGKENEFVEFLSQSDFTVDGSYGETWAYIRQENNSLKRACNLHLYFEGIN